MACSCLWDFVQPFFEKYTISDFEYIVRYRIYIYLYTYIFYTSIEFVTIVCSAFHGLHCNEDILVAFPKLPHANTTQSRRHATQGLHWSSVAGLWCRGTWACATLLPVRPSSAPRVLGNLGPRLWNQNGNKKLILCMRKIKSWRCMACVPHRSQPVLNGGGYLHGA